MARLPNPGSDAGVWGDLLNEFLTVTHNADGTLKGAAVGGSTIQDGAVTTSKIADGQVTTAKLAFDPATQTELDAAISGLSTAYSPLNTATSIQTGSYTLVLADATKAVEIDSGSAANVTIPPNSSVAFPIGTIIEITQLGSGTVTLVAGAGVTLRSRGGVLSLAGQNAVASIRKRATDDWVVAGDLA